MQILVVDDDETFSLAIGMQLEHLGLTARAVKSYGEAERLVRNERRINLVILDHTAAGPGVTDIVASLRVIRPGLMIVGNSGADRRDEFAAAGVRRFLQKPWRIEELLTFINGRIGTCTECGLRLPLRRSLDDDLGDDWACAFCGSRYLGVIDEDAPADLHLNVRRIGES